MVSRQIFGQLVFVGLVLMAAGIGALAGLVFVYSSSLPQVNDLEDYRPDVMTELYADDGSVIGSFALERRVIVAWKQIPPVLFNAVTSIEDRHFESHWGIDVVRIVRASTTDLMEWRKAQGASTLTQQLSRRFFLTPQKSFRRKLQEMLLAIQIERHFTKQQIFTMYSNEMDLGHGNYGFEAASEYYFGKHVSDLKLPEAALLAGIPKSASRYSPLQHPDRALERRNQVLAAMFDNGKITHSQYEQARQLPLGLNIQRWDKNLAPYFVEAVRQDLERKYGAEMVHEKGLRVYSTVNLKLQRMAERALIAGLHVDDKRRGWRGPQMNILKQKPLHDSDDPESLLAAYRHDDWKKPFEPGKWVHGLVTAVKPDHAEVRFGALTARLTPPDYAWTNVENPRALFAPGDVDLFEIKDVKTHSVHATLDQEPNVQGAVVVIDNANGSVKAMVGGRDYNESKFNRAMQAERQVGSSFKVYVYSEAMLDGISPFDKVVDAPVGYPTSSGWWSPHNYDDKYEGNITWLHALAESRNIPAVKLLAKVGVDHVIRLCRKFGVTSRLVPNLPLALGASDLTVLEHTSAFSTFPDDGVHISPRLIDRVTNYDGAVIDEYRPEITDVLPAPVARLMVSMLREPINSGTALAAKSLATKYPLAGKTGTTNDFSDAWFIGFSPTLTCGVWVGFDDHRTLGPKEEGSHVALPIWMDFMSHALEGQPVQQFRYSPLLTNPEQVATILSGAAATTLLAEQNSPPKESAKASESPGAPKDKTERSKTVPGPEGSVKPAAKSGPQGPSSKKASEPAARAPKTTSVPPLGAAPLSEARTPSSAH
jgi:penicillin-binding protein 1A